MLRRSLFSIGIFLTGSILSAKTPQQLKSEMDDLLPSGMKVRMVWSNSPESEGIETVYAYDSDENVIRELTPSSLFENGRRNVSNAYISQDGEYVVLKDKDSDIVQRINFSGNGLAKISDYGEIICTWQDPADKTQYFIASDLPSPNSTGTWAIGITDQSKRRQISTQKFPRETSNWATGSGLSLDGNMIGGFDYNRPGLWPTSGGEFIPAQTGCNGCNFTMRPTAGGVYEWAHWADDHGELCVHNGDGSKKEIMSNYCNVPGGDEPQSLLFTNHINYVTYLMGEGSATNPILFDLAGTRCVALEENECSGFRCSHKRPNAVLLAKGGTESRNVSTMTRPHPVSHSPQKLYSIDGRLLSDSQIGASSLSVRLFRISMGSQGTGVVVSAR